MICPVFGVRSLALKLAIQPELKDGEICKLMAERYHIRYRQ